MYNFVNYFLQLKILVKVQGGHAVFYLLLYLRDRYLRCGTFINEPHHAKETIVIQPKSSENMKKVLFSVIAMIGMASAAQAQFKVHSSGNLSIGGTLEASDALVFMGNRTPMVYNGYAYSLQSKWANSPNTYNIGISSAVLSANVYSSGPVTINERAHVKINASNEVLIKNDFEIKRGATFEISQ